MNIILFVTTLIMAMAMLTYAKLQIFRSFNVLESQFTKYMEDTERSAINQAADRWYHTVKASSKGGGEQTKSSALSRLSFAIFTDKKEQAKKEYPQLRYLAKKLIFVLYHNTPFYHQLERQRPDFVDAMLNSLIIAEGLPDKQKIKSARDLANLRLPDPLLDDALYKMLKGTPLPDVKIPIPTAPVPKKSRVQMEFASAEDHGEEEDDAPDVGLKEEYQSPIGYYSLLDFITMQKSSKIRVFLAPVPMLQAIFEDPSVVPAVLETRRQIYNALIADPKQKTEDLSNQFKKQFLPKVDKNLSEAVLDFSVSKTNPANYD